MNKRLKTVVESRLGAKGLVVQIFHSPCYRRLTIQLN